MTTSIQNKLAVTALVCKYPYSMSGHSCNSIPESVESMFKAELKRKKQGQKLFHFFQKIIGEPGMMADPRVREFAECANSYLQKKMQEGKLSKKVAPQLDGAVLHVQNLLKAEQNEAQANARRAAWKSSAAEELFHAHPDIFPKGVNLLVANFTEIEPSVETAIETALRNALGAITPTFRETLENYGAGIGECVRTLDLHDFDLTTGLTDAQIEAQCMMLVTTFPNLQKLNLQNCHVNPTILQIIAHHLPHLTELNLSDNNLSFFAGIPAVPGNTPFPALKTLHLNNCTMSEHHFTVFPQLPELRHLSCSHVRPANFFVQYIYDLTGISTNFPNLESLNISNSYIAAICLEELLRQLSQLKKLDMCELYSATIDFFVDIQKNFPNIIMNVKSSTV